MNNSVNKCKTIYCHGLPGSDNELFFLSQEGIRPDRVFGPQHEADLDGYIAANSNARLHVIGFSLGAMAAIKITEKNSNAVSQLSLISPAAPLELGNFLPKMAGKAVFETAKRSNIQFRILTAIQNIGVRISSDMSINAIFKGSPEPDTRLLSDQAFKAALVTGLKESYGKNGSTYRRAIHEYVQPWGHRLSRITCPVCVHHGTADNWAPIDMAYALKNEIPANVDIVEYSGLGHFSTLIEALPLAMKNHSL